MKTVSFARFAILILALAAASLCAQAPLAVPGAPVARDVPGAKQSS